MILGIQRGGNYEDLDHFKPFLGILFRLRRFFSGLEVVDDGSVVVVVVLVDLELLGVSDDLVLALVATDQPAMEAKVF